MSTPKNKEEKKKTKTKQKKKTVSVNSFTVSDVCLFHHSLSQSVSQKACWVFPLDVMQPYPNCVTECHQDLQRLEVNCRANRSGTCVSEWNPRGESSTLCGDTSAQDTTACLGKQNMMKMRSLLILLQYY